MTITINIDRVLSTAPYKSSIYYHAFSDEELKIINDYKYCLNTFIHGALTELNKDVPTSPETETKA